MTVIAVILFVGVVRLRLADVPLERDEGEYAYAGQLILEHVPPYALEYNMKFPGTYYAYALILSVFGQTARGVHVGLLCVNAATILLVFAIGRRLTGDLGGAVAAVFFALLSVDRWIMGVFAHASHFVLLPMLGGLLLLLRAFESRRLRTFFFSGSLFGAAILMKQPGAAFAILAVGLTIWQSLQGDIDTGRTRRLVQTLLTLTAGILLPVLVMVGLLWTEGVFGRFWFWTFEYARHYVAELPLSVAWASFTTAVRYVLQDTSALWAVGALGTIAIWIVKWPRLVRVVSIGLLVSSLVAIAPGFYFRPHYFIFLLPVVSLLAGVTIATIRMLLARRFSSGISTIAAGLIMVAPLAAYVTTAKSYLFHDSTTQMSRALYGNNPFVEAPRAAEFVAERTLQSDRIAVVGSEPEIYFYAHRRSATGYVYTYGLTEPQPFALQMQDEMIHEIETTDPKFLIAIWSNLSWLAESIGAGDHIVPWLTRYADHCYELADEPSEFLSIFARKGDGPCGASDTPDPFQMSPSAKSSVAIYHKALRIDPGLAQQDDQRGKSLAESGRVDEALAYFQEALKFDPNLASAHNNIAVALTSQKHLAEAIPEFRAAVTLAPDFAEAHSNLGIVLGQTGDIEEGLRETERAVELQPNRLDFQYNCALLSYRNHDRAKALAHIQAVLAIDPNHDAARQMLAALIKRDQ